MRNLSIRAEFLIVVTVAFGIFIYSSALALLTADSSGQISEAGLVALIVHELIVSAALGIFLSMRGWSLKDIGLSPAWKDTAIGLPLLFVAYAGYYALFFAFGGSIRGANELPTGTIVADLSVQTVLIASCVNGLFEEIFVCGYIIAALKQRRSIFFAVNVSIAIRAAYHLYQGPLGVLSIIPVGLVFGHWFARTGRLWPVVVAHVLADIIGLIDYTVN